MSNAPISAGTSGVRAPRASFFARAFCAFVLVLALGAEQGLAQGTGQSGTQTRRDPFALQNSRLGLLEAASDPLGSTPEPTPEVTEKYKRLVYGMVDPDNTLDLIAGRPRILVFKRTPRRIMIPDETTARYEILTDTELAITGMRVGTTQLMVWFDAPETRDGQEILSYLVRVMPDPEAKERVDRAYRLLEDELNTAFPNSRVHLKLVGDTLMVMGEAPDMLIAEKIIRVIRANAIPPNTTVPVDRFDDSYINPLSTQPTPGMQNFGLTQRNPDGSIGSGGSGIGVNIINLLRVPGEMQVALRVTVAEVNRAAARSIGVNFSYTNNAGITIFEQLTGNIASQGFANIPLVLDNGQLRVAINALRNLDFARSLAEPTLVALNGETASFLAGGEFPVPVVTGATSTGLQGVEFVEFGVSLEFTPFITDRDRVRLVVSAEVSARNLSTGTNINGADVPGRDSRRFQTIVELRDGQTLAVAGLIQTTFGGTTDRVPGAGDLPFIGWLFGFNQNSANETELVILVTPELIAPLDEDETPRFLPGDDMVEPDDIEFFLLNRMESRHLEDYRSPVQTDWARQSRARALEKKFILGPSGYSDGR